MLSICCELTTNDSRSIQSHWIADGMVGLVAVYLVRESLSKNENLTCSLCSVRLD